MTREEGPCATRGISVAATIAALLVSLWRRTGSGQSAAGAERRFTPGSAGSGRPVLPARRQRWVRRQALRRRRELRPRDRAPLRDSDHRGAGHPEPVPVQLRLRRACASQSIKVAGQTSHVDASTRASSSSRRATGSSRATSFTTVVTYQGTPTRVRGPRGRNRGLRAHRRRRGRGRRAARGLDLVPGQRPPHGQGLLLLPHHSARGTAGDRERPTGIEPHPSWLDHLELDRARAHDHLPRDDGDRPLRHPPLPGQRPGLLGCRRPPARRPRRQPASADGIALRLVRRGPRTGSVVQATDAPDRGPGRGRPSCPSGSTATRSASSTSSPWRRTRSGRTNGPRCPTRTATRTAASASPARSTSSCTRS